MKTHRVAAFVGAAALSFCSEAVVGGPERALARSGANLGR